MQMFNESTLCRQSIELFRHKLWYKLNSLHMYYLYTSYKIAKLDHKATNLFMHILNISVLYMQSIRKLQ